MKQDIEAMKTLGYTDQQIGTIFDRRGKGKDFNAIRANKFTPFDIPEIIIYDTTTLPLCQPLSLIILLHKYRY